METLNKRERKLFIKIKKEMNGKKSYTVDGENLHIYSSLLKKLKNSDLVYVIYADNCAFIHNYERLLQFEIEEKEQRKLENKFSSHDYKVAIISAIIGAILSGVLTYLITM